MEHLFCNCHGELAFLLGALPLIPFIGVWLKGKLTTPHAHDEEPHDV